MEYYHPTSKNQCSNSLALPLSDPMKMKKTKYFYAVPTKEFEKIKLIFVPNFGFANLVITNRHQVITHEKTTIIILVNVPVEKEYKL